MVSDTVTALRNLVYRPEALAAVLTSRQVLAALTVSLCSPDWHTVEPALASLLEICHRHGGMPCAASGGRAPLLPLPVLLAAVHRVQLEAAAELQRAGSEIHWERQEAWSGALARRCVYMANEVVHFALLYWLQYGRASAVAAAAAAAAATAAGSGDGEDCGSSSSGAGTKIAAGKEWANLLELLHTSHVRAFEAVVEYVKAGGNVDERLPGERMEQVTDLILKCKRLAEGGGNQSPESEQLQGARRQQQQARTAGTAAAAPATGARPTHAAAQRRCTVCARTATDGAALRRCRGCGSLTGVRYCSMECCRTHWVKQGHRAVCEAAQRQLQKAASALDVVEL
jgi:hypothetical protein